MPEKLFNYEWYIRGLTAFFAAEILSLAAYTVPTINLLALILIIVVTLSLGWKNPKWLLYIPLAELIWGSFGRTFMWQLGDMTLTLRMLLFALVVLIWLVKYSATLRQFPWRSTFGKLYSFFILILCWGILWGLLRGNNLLNIFDDSNGYFFLAYVLIWWSLVTRKDIPEIFSLAAAAVTIISLKTIWIFHLFSHGYDIFNPTFNYLWIRDTRVGELTLVVGNFWRIFFQSQFYIVLIWILTFTWLSLSNIKRLRWPIVLFWGIVEIAIFISFSRSFWLAAVISLAFHKVITFILVTRKRLSFPWRATGHLVMSFVVGAVLLMVIWFIPPVDADLSSALSARLGSTSEAAASSRLNQVPILVAQILHYPLFGSGFGTTLTYQNNDPRIRTYQNEDGSYTTYAFELGWFDIAMKVGIIGFAGIVWFILYILYKGMYTVWKGKVSDPLLISLSVGIIFLTIVHFFTPYINHPIGLSFLAIAAIVIVKDNTSDHESHY